MLLAAHSCLLDARVESYMTQNEQLSKLHFIIKDTESRFVTDHAQLALLGA